MTQNNRPLEKELLDIIFGEKVQVSFGNAGKDCYSTIRASLQQARLNERFGQAFVSLILHLIALEQIGELFCKDVINKDNNGIAKALNSFVPKLEEREIQGIKHLRHALAHNFGLAIIDTIHKNQNAKNVTYNPNEDNYKYILHFKKGNYPMVKKPSNEWDGEFNYISINDVGKEKLSMTNSFVISIPRLVKKIDNIFERLKQKHQKGKLHFVSKSGNAFVTDKELCEIAFKYFVYNE